MPVRTAEAEWKGDLQSGQGQLKLGTGAFEGQYSFKTRMGDDTSGTNPEELIAAAHAACFSMALSAGLARAGFTPTSVKTNARVHFNATGQGYAIGPIELETTAVVPGIDEARFQELANDAKQNCPVSKALAATEIRLQAKLVKQ
ncbi:OsmC family protein [Thermogemmatispora tikiterensis]|uniref:Peroxiredoxin n=1 Tax=Thermogemmatispora tikiterensis TaxID=1825093 RepID=A0A328VKZ3_9CHLR|nr:OsmC family protein [Thermogemmatispora tikiterensis]RAQ97531.1 peroxiredoxin [Thermogemmatispora tikiterensis]